MPPWKPPLPLPCLGGCCVERFKPGGDGVEVAGDHAAEGLLGDGVGHFGGEREGRDAAGDQGPLMHGTGGCPGPLVISIGAAFASRTPVLYGDCTFALGMSLTPIIGAVSAGLMKRLYV